jgi:hypothetical protein
MCLCFEGVAIVSEEGVLRISVGNASGWNRKLARSDVSMLLKFFQAVCFYFFESISLI